MSSDQGAYLYSRGINKSLLRKTKPARGKYARLITYGKNLQDIDVFKVRNGLL